MGWHASATSLTRLELFFGPAVARSRDVHRALAALYSLFLYFIISTPARGESSRYSK